jgi:putative addiction module killer protein
LSQIEIKEYVTAQGHNLFRRWVDRLDKTVQERVYARIRRMAAGNFGKGRHLGGGMHEAIFDFGPGYRAYYGCHEGKMILLLCGGDKSNQAKDIQLAAAYWLDYKNGGSK